jgi:putative transposase
MDTVYGSNQLWEMDIKYGYIAGTDEFFFQLSVIDVFDRSIIDYHLGLSCTAQDACRVLKSALANGSIKYMAPNKFYEAFMSNTVNIEAFSA